MTEMRMEPLPISVLTGFLGSGKTIFLRRALADPRLTDTAVVINEFGAMGLDHLLVEAADQEVLQLPNGCVCCAVRQDLADTLYRLLRRRLVFGSGDVLDNHFPDVVAPAVQHALAV